MNEPGWRERLFDGAIDLAMWATATLAIAGVTHLTSILAMPRLAPHDAYARMEKLAPTPHRTTLLPQAGAAGEAPMDDPALERGVCRYDLSQGPLRLRANLAPEALMLMSFHSRYGEVYYSMTDRSATRGRLEALLFLEEQRDDVEADDSEDELPQELRIVSPTPQGFVLFRALAERPGEHEAARARIAAIQCGLDASMKDARAD